MGAMVILCVCISLLYIVFSTIVAHSVLMVDVSQSANTKETHIQQKVDEILFGKRQFYYILIWSMEYSCICAPLLICKFDFLLSGLALVPDRDIRKRLFIKHFTIHKNSIFPNAFIRMEYNRKCFYR